MQLTNPKDHSLRTKEGLEAQLANAKHVTTLSQICTLHVKITIISYRGGALGASCLGALYRPLQPLAFISVCP
jgi:hypothetical protein